MKSSLALLVATAAAASAKPQSVPDNVKINCSKPNATFCMGETVLLVCDENSMGTRKMCTEDLPPTADSATCHESAKEAGDAVCKKPDGEASVSAQPPSDTWKTATSPADAGTTGIYSIPEGTGSMPVVTTTPSMSAPETMTAAPTTTMVNTPVGPPPIGNGTILTNPIRTSTKNVGGGDGGNQPTASGGDGSDSPKPTESSPSSGAAAAHQATGLLAAVGMVVAFFV